MFVLENPLESVWRGFAYWDELVALLGIFLCIVAWKELDRRTVGILILLMFFVGSGLIGNLVYHIQPLSVAVSDAFLNMKFWLALAAGQYFGRRFDIKEHGEYIVSIVSYITYIYFALMILDNIFGLFYPIMRSGFRTTHLFYYHPTHFAAIGVFLTVVLLSLWDVKNTPVQLAILLVMLCTTLRSKAVAAAALVVLIYYWSYKKERRIKVEDIIIALPLILAIGWNKIVFYFSGTISKDSARSVLLNTSFKVAGRRFPLGAGFGTFASYLSGVHYSPLYYAYGISKVHGIRPTNYSYISDSFWPMILGQNGYIGLALFIAMVLLWISKVTELRVTDKAFYTAGLVGVSYLLIASTAESSFVNPIVLPIAVWTGIMAGNASRIKHE